VGEAEVSGRMNFSSFLFLFLSPFDAIARAIKPVTLAGPLCSRPFMRAVHKVAKVQEFTGAARRVDGVTFRLKTARLVKRLDVGVYLTRFIGELAVYITRPFPFIVFSPRIADAIRRTRLLIMQSLRIPFPCGKKRNCARTCPGSSVRFSIFHFANVTPRTVR